MHTFTILWFFVERNLTTWPFLNLSLHHQLSPWRMPDSQNVILMKYILELRWFNGLCVSGQRIRTKVKISRMQQDCTLHFSVSSEIMVWELYNLRLWILFFIIIFFLFYLINIFAVSFPMMMLSSITKHI